MGPWSYPDTVDARPHNGAFVLACLQTGRIRSRMTSAACGAWCCAFAAPCVPGRMNWVGCGWNGSGVLLTLESVVNELHQNLILERFCKECKRSRIERSLTH